MTVLAADLGSGSLLTSILAELATLQKGAVLGIEIGDLEQRVDFARRWVMSGHRLLNPFAHFLDPTLLLQKQA